MLTVGEMKDLIRDVPDSYVLKAAGIEGPKAVLVSGTSNPEDEEFVVLLEAKSGRRRELRIQVIDQ